MCQVDLLSEDSSRCFFDILKKSRFDFLIRLEYLNESQEFCLFREVCSLFKVKVSMVKELIKFMIPNQVIMLNFHECIDLALSI